MVCIVCGEVHKYKCPQCSQGYCSVACFKTHKEVCAGKVATEEKPDKPQSVTSNPEYDQLLEDPELRALINQTSVQHHLRVVADIMQDGRLSGEQTTEGRQIVAVKKLRELRMGGREQNEAVEQFVRRVLAHNGHVDEDSDDVK